jgi:hypothetical protein
LASLVVVQLLVELLPYHSSYSNGHDNHDVVDGGQVKVVVTVEADPA